MKQFLSVHLYLGLVTFFCFTGRSFCQAVSEKQGNIYFTGKDGHVIQLTSSGLDLHPSLSVDGSLVVFVRRTPSHLINTGLGETDQNEIWIAPTSGISPAYRVLAGQPGGSDPSDMSKFVLGGIVRPQFSPDATRIYFLDDTAATTSSILVLDLTSRKIRFLCDGLSVEVIKSGRRRGDLIVNKEIRRAIPPASVFRYWLLDPDGNDVGEIGDESDLREAKKLWD